MHPGNIKKILLYIVLVLYSSFAAAASADVASDKGFVSLTVVNRAPVITNIYFNPEVAFEDSKLECIVAVNDENTDETIIIYKWYVNNKSIETSNDYLEGFNENDIVRCEATPIDNENVTGETKSASITINKKPALSAITGFITKSYETGSLPLISLFGVLLFIAFFITIAVIIPNLPLKKRTKN